MVIKGAQPKPSERLLSALPMSNAATRAMICSSSLDSANLTPFTHTVAGNGPGRYQTRDRPESCRADQRK